jgi:ribosomal protein RSM22 (predicted rRNA methylase)
MIAPTPHQQLCPMHRDATAGVRSATKGQQNFAVSKKNCIFAAKKENKNRWTKDRS